MQSLSTKARLDLIEKKLDLLLLKKGAEVLDEEADAYAAAAAGETGKLKRLIGERVIKKRRTGQNEDAQKRREFNRTEKKERRAPVHAG